MSAGQVGGARFDQASHTPLNPAARAALEAALDSGWGDPARLHHGGRQARQALELARQSLAQSLGCRHEEVYFTSSGTTAVHAALGGLLRGRARVSNVAVAGSVEHSSVLHALSHAGADTRLVPVDQLGRLALEQLEITPETALVAVQSANHEVGTTQPLAEVAKRCRQAGAPLVVDACVTLPWAAPDFAWDVLIGSAHKWGGPAGVGVLAVRTGTRWRSPFPEDERGWGAWPGFQNVAGIVSAAAALNARRNDPAAASRVAALTAQLRTRLAELVPDCVVLGDGEQRAPHIVTASMLYVDGEAMLTELDRHGIEASSGSSCTSSTLTPSHVLEAMGVLTHGNLRLSLGPDSTQEELDHLLGVLPGVVAEVRERLGARGL